MSQPPSETSPEVLKEPFNVGQRVTTHELRTAYKEINGTYPPPGTNLADLARTLSTGPGALRFEYEVNRQRGWGLPAQSGA